MQRGNPLGLRSWADLIHSGAVLANRERGAAARVLLDERLRIMEADPKTIPGYEREVSSALVQGSLIARKDADVGVGTEKVYHIKCADSITSRCRRSSSCWWLPRNLRPSALRRRCSAA